MRFHRMLLAFALWNEALLRDLVDVRYLVAARLEPYVRTVRRFWGGGLDLVFTDGGRIAVVPFIDVEEAMLLVPEDSPIVWPAAAECVDRERLLAVEREIVPWIAAEALGRSLQDERIRITGDDAFAQTFALAREGGFLGAASYERVLTGAAPYLYAARLAHGRSVAVFDENGAAGARVLAREARAVSGDFGTRNEAASLWYGALERPGTQPAEIVIAQDAEHRGTAATLRLDAADASGEALQFATPVPIVLPFALNDDETPPTRIATVAFAQPRSIRAVGNHVETPEGGSSGRVLFVVRDDWQATPDADVEEAEALACALQDEGFTITFAPAGSVANVDADLVHLTNLRHARAFLPIAQAARRAGVPVVARPCVTDLSARSVWGAGIARLALERTDERQIEDYLSHLRFGRIVAEGLHPGRTEPYPGYDAALDALLPILDAAIVAAPQEEAFLRSRGFRGAVERLAGFAAPPAQPAGVCALVGLDDYVLVHAPLESRTNPFLVLRAAREAGLPLVFMGPVLEADLLAFLRLYAGARFVLLPELDPAHAEAVYRGARVYADLAWSPQGLGRAVRAARAGCALVLSTEHYGGAGWASDLRLADPADGAAMALALGEAFNDALAAPALVRERAARIAASGTRKQAVGAAARAYAAASVRGAPA